MLHCEFQRTHHVKNENEVNCEETFCHDGFGPCRKAHSRQPATSTTDSVRPQPRRFAACVGIADDGLGNHLKFRADPYNDLDDDN